MNFETTEEWKLCPASSDYEISSLGRLRRVTRKAGATVGKVLAQRCDRKGYVIYGIPTPIGAKTVKAHRLVATAFIPNPNSLPQVNHIDGNKTNNCAGNLEWCTNSQNMAHSFKYGAHRFVRSAIRKLSPDTVKAIRDMASAGSPKREIARGFGIDNRTVRDIVARRTWKDVA